MSIVDFISSWLKDIVVLFILISIAGLIMPKGNMKRYIDLVIGLLIIFTIISPFTKLMKMDFNLEEAVFNYSKAGDFIKMGNDEFYLEQEKQIEKVYKEKISSEIIKLIEEESIYKVADVSIGLLDDKEKYGDIEYLNILLSESMEDLKENKVSIKRIDPIDINKEKDKIPVNNEEKYKDLKKLISTKYSIENDKINIMEYEKGKGGYSERNIGED